MTTVLCRCRVADYDSWRPGYEQAVQATPSIRSIRTWRGQDDPNLVVVEETFDTREAANAAWSAPGLEAEMEAHGIDMASLWVEYFDEVDPPELSKEA